MYLPSPDLLGKVPDLLHGHKLATVSTVKDYCHVVLGARFSHFQTVVNVEVIKNQDARLHCNFAEAFDEGKEGVCVVAFLSCLTD